MLGTKGCHGKPRNFLFCVFLPHPGREKRDIILRPFFPRPLDCLPGNSFQLRTEKPVAVPFMDISLNGQGLFPKRKDNSINFDMCRSARN